MKKTFTIVAAALIVGSTLMTVAPSAQAGDHGRVNWSISIGVPYPPPIIYSPAPVYVEPQPVYVQPQPFYVQPAPVIQYGRPYYYYDNDSYGRPYHPDHWRRHHHHD
jgi:hypothetical protein